MKKCKLCKEKDANKKNTHYLTDSIIRTCLNLNGTNDREAGFYFDVSNNNPFVDFNFQRGTSIPKLEESLGRQATDDEIEKAKKIPFSVDYMFCSECEDIFTKIETPFVDTILPLFRQNDLTGIEKIELNQIKIVKLFFYLQVWRMAICEEVFNLCDSTMEVLRNIILNSDSLVLSNIPKFPFHITYLQTVGEDIAYTSNFVGCTSDKNPNIIFMNDFVIQFFENSDLIRTLELYGLNKTNDLEQFINIENEKVQIKILPNQTRIEIIEQIYTNEKVQITISYFVENFTKLWFQIFRGFPHPYLIQDFLNFITTDDFDILKYTPESILEKTRKFIELKIKV